MDCRICWWCTCNNSCTCTIKAKLDYERKTGQSAWAAIKPKEIDFDWDKLKWLSFLEAVELYKKETWVKYINIKEKNFILYSI